MIYYVYRKENLETNCSIEGCHTIHVPRPEEKGFPIPGGMSILKKTQNKSGCKTKIQWLQLEVFWTQ